MIGDLELLARLAARQHGAFSTAQATACGLSADGLGSLVRSGWCERSARGVYRVRAAVRSKRQRIAIAVLSAGTDACASHGSAALLLELPGFAGAVPEVSRPRGRSQRSAEGIVHGSLWLPPEHLSIRHGIPTTIPARTAFDLAAQVPPARVAQVVDELTGRGLCTIGRIQQVFFVLARRGRPGTAAMRDLLEHLTDERMIPASELERAFRRLLRSAGLPMPRFEVDVGTDAWIGRVDALWEDVRVIVELDSRRHHGGAVAREADRRRDNALMATGWRVLRFTWDDVHERPAEVIAALRVARAAVHPSNRLQ